MMLVRSVRSRMLSSLLAAALVATGILPVLPPPAAAAAPRTAAAQPPATAGGAREPRNVSVRWAPGIPAAQIGAAADRLGFRVVRASRQTGWSLVASTRSGVTPEALVASLRGAGLVSKAQVERIYTPTGLAAPNDPLFATQWALQNTGQTGGTPGADISAPEAWTRTTGSKNVVVAVVDTGMYYAHPDLKANVWTNPGEIPGNGFDDDGNGFVDDYHGYDFGNRDATVYDPDEGEQHATHVAGIIGAAGNNLTGVTGVNWNVTVMPVKFLTYGYGTDFDGADAIHYAVDNGADVINCSWGGSEDSELLDEAIAYAAARGVLVVTAAGNDWADVDETPFYPGCIDSTAIVNVAATDDDDKLAEFSNYGGTGVDIAAPGVDVASTLPYECAGAFIDSFPYKAEVLGFPLEAVQPVSTRDALLQRSLAQLAPLTDAVLVVDDSEPEAYDETPGTRLGSYLDALHAAGYTNVTTWSVEAQGTPPLAVMDRRTVVWFTGAVISPFFGSDGIIDASERAVLGTFMDQGGRLLLSSGDAVFDLIWWDPEWLERYFHLFPADVATWGFGLQGVPGSAFEGIEGSVPSDLGEAASDSFMLMTDEARPIVGLGGYGPLSGTSMATPHVTGAAALLMAAFPSASSAEIKDRLLNTVDPKDSLRSTTALGGRLNVYAAMQDFAGRPEITQPATGEVLRGGRTQTLAWRTSAQASAEQTFEAQLGLPVTAFSEDFEGGALGVFATSATNGWETTAGASSAHGAVGGTASGISSMWTSVTVPPHGELSFSYAYQGDPWMSGGLVSVDETENVLWGTFYPRPWGDADGIPLPEGEHRLILSFVQYAEDATDTFAVDDVRVSGYDFEPLCTAPAGSVSATFAVPMLDVPKAKLRMRSHLGAHASAWSDEAEVRISTDATPPAAPGSFSAVAGGDGDVDLAWTNPSAGEGAVVRLLRRLDAPPSGPGDPSATTVYEGAATSFRDTCMKNGDAARYAAYAIDPAENVSPAARATVTVSDHVAPPAVTKLQAGLTGGVPRIVWLAPPIDQCTAVTVLRRTDTTPTGPTDPDAALVYDGPASAASDYLLTRHGFDGTAYYAVFPRDLSGNVGPRAAVRLRVQSAGMAGTLVLNGGAAYCTTAAVTASSDVTGAVRMRFDVGDGYAAWLPYARTRGLTLVPALDGLHVVKAEYESATGQRLELTARIFLELTPPQPPTALKAESLNTRTKLTWTASRSSDVVSYDLYRADAATGPFELFESVETSAEGFVVDEASAGGFFRMTAVDVAGMKSVPSAVVKGLPGPAIARVAGADRYATAVLVSKRHFPSAETVVLATGENFADALSASGLAGSYDAPVLLTRKDSLPATVAGEIARLKAKRVFVIGSGSAISTAVAASLEASYTVRRIAGADRYATAAAVARAIDSHETTAPTVAALVNGTSFADGTAISAAAYAAHMPVFLTRPGALPAVTASTMAWLGLEQVYVIGGETAVSWEVEGQLPTMAMRLAGENRYQTAAFVAEEFVASGDLSYDYVAVASGRNYPDALSGGAGAGKEGGVILLTEPADAPLDLLDVFAMNAWTIDRVDVLGSAKTVAALVPARLQSALAEAAGPIMPAEEMPPWEEPYGEF